MALSEHEFVVRADRNLQRNRGEKWLEILRRWLVQCPNCSETRLAVGVQENDRYVCKGCGHSFSIKFGSQSTTNVKS
jgi:hypothetical protein